VHPRFYRGPTAVRMQPRAAPTRLRAGIAVRSFGPAQRPPIRCGGRRGRGHRKSPVDPVPGRVGPNGITGGAEHGAPDPNRSAVPAVESWGGTSIGQLPDSRWWCCSAHSGNSCGHNFHHPESRGAAFSAGREHGKVRGSIFNRPVVAAMHCRTALRDRHHRASHRA
jgi:hypothetical protein